MKTTLYGHESKRQALKRLYERQRIPHAFLFSGMAGVGKKRVALELYQTFYCEQSPQPYGGCGTCKQCTLFTQESMPNCVIIDCSIKEQVTTEKIRELLYSLHLRVSAGQRRVVVLDNAENLSIGVQNLLLKALEEPRPDTLFCLITSSQVKLLPTILSRCQQWFFDALSPVEIGLILNNQTFALPPDCDLTALTLLADGSLENISTMVDHMDHWREMNEFTQLLSSQKISEVCQRIQAMKGEKDLIRIRLSALRVIARQAMLRATENTQQLAWSTFLANIIEAERLILERNLSPELVLEHVALSLLMPGKTLGFTSVGNDARLLVHTTV